MQLVLTWLLCRCGVLVGEESGVGSTVEGVTGSNLGNWREDTEAWL